ncbi:MAG: TlpA disulfide reductase family protein [Acidobacteriota bacterium]
MRRSILVTLITILGLVSLLLTPGSSVYMQSEKTRKAPNFTYPDLTKKKHTLASLSGKVVIINFWATWCGPCQKEIPSFIKLQKKYGDKLAILGVSYDQTQDIVDEFVKKNEVGRQINYPIVFNGQLESFFGDQEAIPTTFVIDKKGFIRDEHVGFATYEKFDTLVEKLISEN